MNLSDIASTLKAKPCGGGYRARCPAHKDKHPSLWFGERQGKLYFQCKAGCDYQAIRAAIGLRGRVSVDSLPVSLEDDEFTISLRRSKLRALWDRSVAVRQGSPVWKYLESRRIATAIHPFPAVIRESPSLKYFNSDGEYVDSFPCMITRLDAPDGSIASIHRTYLTFDGAKAPVDKPKKLMPSPTSGATDGAAIKLIEPGRGIISEQSDVSVPGQVNTVLGIAEGIETALACYTLFGIPTWAAWSSSGLAKVVLPENLTDLIIFADHDSAGLKYANELIRRLHAERPKLTVRLHKPKQSGTDFADELMNA